MNIKTGQQRPRVQSHSEWFRSATEEILKEICNSRPISHRRLLYHYTDADGLVSIDKGLELWATDLRYVNDASELQEAYNIFREELTEKLDRFPMAIRDRAEWLDHVMAYDSRWRVYAFSFSENGDDLGQWRGYCPNGRGYSLGFDVRKLLDTDGLDSSWNLAPCIYDADTQRGLMAKVVSNCLRYAKAELQRESPDEARSLTMAALATQFLYVAPFIKNSAFKNERE